MRRSFPEKNRINSNASTTAATPSAISHKRAFLAGSCVNFGTGGGAGAAGVGARAGTGAGIRTGANNCATCCRASTCVDPNAKGREESTSTMPTHESCASMGTAIAERRCRFFATEDGIRESVSASSQTTTCPVSKHSLVSPLSACSLEPTAGASPVLARQTTPHSSQRAIAAPSAPVREHTRSTTRASTADGGRS